MSCITSCKNKRLSEKMTPRLRSLLSPVAISIGMVFFQPFDIHAELYFPPELLASDLQMVADLSRFETAGAQLPGNYQVDIFLNGKEVASRYVQFIGATDMENNSSAIRDNTGLMACLTRSDLAGMGINVKAFHALTETAEDRCITPGTYIPSAFTAFDFQKMRLDISIPQAAMQNSARGYIPPERWDEGITAALLNYNYSGNNSHGHYGDSESHYLNLHSGLNLGPWRLRDVRNWNEYSSPHYRYRRWQHVKTYASSAIVPLRSELVLGDSTTNGDVFDSLGFRGFQLATDDNMFPDSQRGFAPVVRGTATTNARVSISQNGYTVYQTFVSPGAFVIDDLYPVYSSGDLEVTVTEADGVVRIFTVPYSSVPVLQREGRLKYTVTVGRYQSSSDRYETPEFAQGSLIWGLPHNITVYGGMQYSENYRAGLLGAGFNMGMLGAVSADITNADSTLADGTRHQGQSMRFLYARSLNSLGTTFQLTGYRYSTQGFHTLDETALKGMKGWLYDVNTVDASGMPFKQQYTDYYNLYNNRRAKIQASLSQRVGSLGSVFISGVRQTYWNTAGSSDSLQAGFSSAVGSVNYSVNYSHSRQTGRAAADKSAFLSMSVPLRAMLPGSVDRRSTMYATWNTSRSSDSTLTHQAGLSGTALEGANLNWNLSQGYGQHSGSNGSLSANYRGTYGSGNLGYSYSSDHRQVNYGLAGGVLLHNEGVTFGQPLGDTSVLVAVPGVADVALENEIGVRTDWRGYAIKSYATMYRENRIALNTASLDERVDIDEAVTRVIPTRGAIVKASFKGHTGGRVVMTLTHKGKPLPFGTTVTVGERGGIVGDDGQVYLSGMPDAGSVRAEWGKGKYCTANYRLPSEAARQAVIRINSNCK
jgi:outer membrane usher protein